ncbi:hypothetical protein GCM10010307_67820 [Streptomyces vastus]|uniref:Uncharacterized protein n=1 Tax=Streptomyces vastus TaxID=285451 RepID=A0ABP6DZY0_9ACTN
MTSEAGWEPCGVPKRVREGVAGVRGGGEASDWFSADAGPKSSSRGVDNTPKRIMVPPLRQGAGKAGRAV